MIINTQHYHHGGGGALQAAVLHGATSRQSLLMGRPTSMSMRVRIAAVAFASAMMLAVVGCSMIPGMGGHSKNQSASTAATPPADTSLPGRWTTDVIAKAFTEINQKIGANPADYVDVLLNGYQLRVNAINPQKRQNVDAYVDDGTGVTVAPVDVSHNEPGAVEESVFKSDTLKPEVFGKVMASALKDSGVEDVIVKSVLVKKSYANDPEPIIQVAVDGPRASKVVLYHLNGQFQEVI
jgi:hypothetical protein